MIKTISFFFLFYNVFNRPFFSLLSNNLEAAKTLKTGDSAGCRRILTTLLNINVECMQNACIKKLAKNAMVLTLHINRTHSRSHG